MADKGFIMRRMLSDVWAMLLIPPFKSTTPLTQRTSSKRKPLNIRVLVERAIRRVKECHIWDMIIPLTLAGSVNQLWRNCCLNSELTGPSDSKG